MIWYWTSDVRQLKIALSRKNVSVIFAVFCNFYVANTHVAICQFHGYDPRVSDFVSFLAAAVWFSVGFHNIGGTGIISTGGERPSQEVRLSKCQQKCQHVTPRYFGQQVLSIKQIQWPANSLTTTSMFSISPIQIFNDQLELGEWCVSKQNTHSSIRSFNISNEFILVRFGTNLLQKKGALWKMH